MGKYKSIIISSSFKFYKNKRTLLYTNIKQTYSRTKTKMNSIAFILLITAASILAHTISKPTAELSSSGSTNSTLLNGLKAKRSADYGIPCHRERLGDSDYSRATFCRCSNNAYGLTCDQLFNDPCYGSHGTYHAAAPQIPYYEEYFVQCSWGKPYLMKCAPATRWSQADKVCVWKDYAAHTDEYGYVMSVPKTKYHGASYEQTESYTVGYYPAPTTTAAYKSYSAPVRSTIAPPAYDAYAKTQHYEPSKNAPVMSY